MFVNVKKETERDRNRGGVCVCVCERERQIENQYNLPRTKIHDCILNFSCVIEIWYDVDFYKIQLDSYITNGSSKKVVLTKKAYLHSFK